MSQDSAQESFSDLINQLADEFITRQQDALVKGAEEYGAFTFLEKDTLEEALQELVDFANYVMMTFVKLKLLQMSLVETIAKSESAQTLGPQSLMKMQDFKTGWGY